MMIMTRTSRGSALGFCRVPRFLLGACLVCAVASMGCMTSTPAGLRLDRSDSERLHQRPTFGQPIFVPFSNTVLFPFALESEEDKGFSGSSFTSSSFFISGSSSYSVSANSADYGSGSIRWNNVVFYHAHARNTRLLLDRPAFISFFYGPDPEKKRGPVWADYLLFGVTDRDTNGDKILNEEDAVVLVCTDLDGNQPRALTPAEQRVEDVNARDGESVLYLHVRRDSDGDGRFTDKDEVTMMRVDPRAPETLKPVLPETLLKRAAEFARPTEPGSR